MVSRIIRIFLIAALTGVSVWQFWDGNIGNGIFSIILALIVLFTYFKNEWMLMAMFAMRKNNTEKAERYLMRIKDPDRALVRARAAQAALELALRLAQGKVPAGTQALTAAQQSDDEALAALDEAFVR